MLVGPSLEYVINFYEEAVSQLIKTTKAPKEKASLKVGIMILYFWALVYNKQVAIDNVKKEGAKYLTNADEFFSQAIEDFNKLKESKHPIIDKLAQLTLEDYQLLIDYFQNSI